MHPIDHRGCGCPSSVPGPCQGDRLITMRPPGRSRASGRLLITDLRCPADGQAPEANPAEMRHECEPPSIAP
jgi:hypothetical protein